MIKHLTVSAAIIIQENKILCLQRNKSKYPYISYKFEFPGGKVEPNESKEQALVREIKEELNIDLNIIKEFLEVEHTYPDFSITMYSYLCSANMEKLLLKEHISFKLLTKNELETLDWAEADLPIVEKLMQTKYALF